MAFSASPVTEGTTIWDSILVQNVSSDDSVLSTQTWTSNPEDATQGQGQCPFGVSWTDIQGVAWTILGFLVLILITVVGNLLIILAIWLEPKLHTLSNMFYISLASADMMVGLLVMPLMLVYTIHGCWPLGTLVCDLWMSVDFLCCTASFYGLCAIVGDRYSAIADPFGHMRKQTKTRVRVIILIIWVCAGLAWIPAIFINRELSGKTQDIECDYAVGKVYILISCIFAYYIPIIVMVTYFILLFMAIRHTLGSSFNVKFKVSKQLDSSTTGSMSSVVTSVENDQNTEGIHGGNGQAQNHIGITKTGYGSNLEQKRKHEESRIRAQKEHKAMVMLGVIMTVFLLCWCWWVITWPVGAFVMGSIPNWLYELSSWAAYINSGVNPFLYVFSNRDFRIALKKIIFKFCSSKDGQMQDSNKSISSDPIQQTRN